MPTRSLKRHVRQGNSNNAGHRVQEPRQPNRKDKVKLKGNVRRKAKVNGKLRNKAKGSVRAIRKVKANARIRIVQTQMARSLTVNGRAPTANPKGMGNQQMAKAEISSAPMPESQATAPARDQARIKTCPKLRVISHSRRIHS